MLGRKRTPLGGTSPTRLYNKSQSRLSIRFDKKIKSIARYRYLYFMILPAFVLTFIFNYIPLAGWLMAFKRYKLGSNLLEVPWVGLMYFKTFFLESRDYIYVIRNTLAINIFSIPLILILGMVLAILLREIYIKQIPRIVQTVTFFPFFISWVVVYSIFNALLAARSGALNETLVKLGILDKGINFLGEAKYAWPLIISSNAWKFVGYRSVIFIATLAGIPPEMYESADIDGAGRFTKMWHITLPYLMRTMIVLLILQSGWVLNSNFGQLLLFTNALNWERMQVFDTYIYKFGLQLMNYSYATAIGIVKTFVSIILLVTTNFIAKKFAGVHII